MNFTQLGQFMVFLGDGIFKVQKKWNSNNGKQAKHCDDDKEKVYTKAAYSTACVTFTMECDSLIKEVMNEWQAKGRLKLIIKDIQAPGSKLVAVIYHMSNLSPASMFKDALQKILRKTKAAENLKANLMSLDDDNLIK